MAESSAVCWICLGGGSTSSASSLVEEGVAEQLITPCACPRPVHETCLAKWQLHCAGKEEESCCRFCKQPLPQWRQTLQSTSRRRNDSQQQQQTPPSPPPAADAAAAVPPLPAQQVAPLMSIQFHGHTYWLQVHSGQGGVDQFKADVRRLLGLSGDDQFEITFECQMPGDGGKVELHGLQAYDAAVYCAELTAAERMAAAAAAATPGATAPDSPDSSSPSLPGDGRGDDNTHHHTPSAQCAHQSGSKQQTAADADAAAANNRRSGSGRASSSSSGSSDGSGPAGGRFARSRSSSASGSNSSGSGGGGNGSSRGSYAGGVAMAQPGCGGDVDDGSWVLGRASSYDDDDAGSYGSAWEGVWRDQGAPSGVSRAAGAKSMWSAAARNLWSWLAGRTTATTTTATQLHYTDTL